MNALEIYYFYPKSKIVGQDMNLIRIVDKNKKESLIVYATFKNRLEKSLEKDIAEKNLEKDTVVKSLEKDTAEKNLEKVAINITNTLVGEEIKLFDIKDIQDVECVVSKISDSEEEILKLEDIYNAEEYIRGLF
ncbi:MAG: hypothetical protein LBR30_03895 [Clostridioides sp.]|nr:hypothetical protein [Clostridioides sp.]